MDITADMAWTSSCGFFVGASFLVTQLVLYTAATMNTSTRATTENPCEDPSSSEDETCKGRSEDLLQETWFIIVLACGGVVVLAIIMAIIIVVCCCRKREKPVKPSPKLPSRGELDKRSMSSPTHTPAPPLDTANPKSKPERDPAPPPKTNPNPPKTNPDSPKTNPNPPKTRAMTIPSRPAPPPPLPPRSANTLQANTRMGQTDIEDGERGNYENVDFSKLEENMDGWAEYLQEEKDRNHLNGIFVHSLADRMDSFGAWTERFKISKTHQQKIEKCCPEESRPQTIDIAGAKFTLDKDNISQLSFHGSRRKKSEQGHSSEVVFAGVNKGYVIVVTADTPYRDQCEKTFYELQRHLMEMTENNNDGDLYANVAYGQ